MFTLLEIELRKLVPSRDFWLSVTVYVILMPAVFLSLKLFNLKVPNSDIGFNLYDFPDVWHNLAYIAQWVNYLLYIIVLQTVTHEYQFRTIRQNIIDGLSPWQYLWGKVILLMVFTLGSTLLVAVLALLGGLFMSDNPDQSQMFVKIEYVGLYCLQLFGYLSLAMLIGTLVRKTGMAILAFTGYTLMVEALLRNLFLPRAVGRYLPSHMLDRLVPNPFFGYVGMGAPAPVDPSTIGISGMYIIAFVLISGWLIAKKDL
jgi:ABC-2 type transport system permease protein